MNLDSIKSCQPRVVFTDPTDEGFPITFIQEWEGPRVRTKMRNDGDRPVRIHEVILADIKHGMPGDTKIYGEGFTHLSAVEGTIENPVDLGSYTDRKHYRLPVPEGATTVYGMLLFSPKGSDHVLLGFSTALKFVGKFNLWPERVEVVQEGEDIAIDPGEIWYLEDFLFLTGADRSQVMAELASHMAKQHKADVMPELPPAGWCSWYCFGSKVTAEGIRANLDYIAENVPELKYIQIDDGYQAAIGDWLDTGDAFGGGIREIIQDIRDRGLEPAIWLAPFVAQPDSKVLRDHPDWFVKDDEGNPLPSDRVTFGGWHFPPWYVLDCTHPEVQDHLLKVFSTMWSEWGIKYFKLDACFWGAIHGGHRYNPKMTRVQAYRLGLRMMQRGMDWTFMLVGNHPTWPSMGIAQAWRTSDDISRTWASFRKTGRQNLMRNWTNGKLLWNDADCIVLTGDLPENEFQFHATVVYASGGSILSGDDLPTILPHRLKMLRKLLPPTGVAADFEDESLEVGTVRLPGRQMVCLFNWQDEPKKLAFLLDKRSHLRDFWTDEDLDEREGLVEFSLDPHSAMLIECRPGDSVGSMSTM